MFLFIYFALSFIYLFYFFSIFQGIKSKNLLINCLIIRVLQIERSTFLFVVCRVFQLLIVLYLIDLYPKSVVLTVSLSKSLMSALFVGNGFCLCSRPRVSCTDLGLSRLRVLWASMMSVSYTHLTLPTKA